MSFSVLGAIKQQPKASPYSNLLLSMMKEWIGIFLRKKYKLKYSDLTVQVWYYKLKIPQHFALAIIPDVENCASRNIPLNLNLRYFIQCVLPFCCLQPSARFFFSPFFRRCFERNIP